MEQFRKGEMVQILFNKFLQWINLLQWGDRYFGFPDYWSVHQDIPNQHYLYI